MNTKKVIAALRRLAQLDVDAIGTYDAAIERIDIPLVKEKLAEFRVDHRRHVQDLNAELVRLGGEPVEQKPDLKGAVLKGFTAVSATMGTEGALLAMLGNEELTNRAYEAAQKLECDATIHALLAKNLEDERRHLGWIKDAALHRPWVPVAGEPVRP